MKKLLMLTVVAVTLLMTSCMTHVSPTEAGFEINNSGNYRGVDSLPLLTGWNWYTPGVSYVITIPTTIQHEVWTDSKDEGQNGENAISISCQGGSGFRVDIGLNYHVNPYRASHIYLKWKDDDLDHITNTYIKNIVRGSMQDISGHVTLDSILNNLPAFEHASGDLISQRLAADGFLVDGFNVTSQPRPSDPNLAASINAKIKARQDAETAVMQLQISTAEANKQIAKAKGDSASAVIEASGRAEAIQKLQNQLTPTYVEYVKAQAWDGKLPGVMAGTGGMILQLKQQ